MRSKQTNKEKEKETGREQANKSKETTKKK